MIFPSPFRAYSSQYRTTLAPLLFPVINFSSICLKLCLRGREGKGSLYFARGTPCTALSLLLYHLPIPVSPLELSVSFTPTLYPRTFTQNLPGQPLGALLNAGESAPWPLFVPKPHQQHPCCAWLIRLNWEEEHGKDFYSISSPHTHHHI